MGHVHQLLFKAQLLAVRNLTDTYGLTGKKGVCSLHALLKNMETNLPLITRADFISAQGLEYDDTTRRKNYERLLKERFEAGEQAFFAPQSATPMKFKIGTQIMIVSLGFRATDEILPILLK